MENLIGDFVDDVREGFARVQPLLAPFEANVGERDALDALFRFVHTVHGNAGFLRLDRFGRLASAAEDMLAQLRDRRIADSAAARVAVSALVLRIGALADAIDAGLGIPAQDEPEMIARLGIEYSVPRVAALIETGVQIAKARSIRMSAERFDHLASCIEHVAEAYRAFLSSTAPALDPAMVAGLGELGAKITEMDVALSNSRLQPVDRLFVALDRVVSQTAETLGKQAQIELIGGKLMIDRDVIDGLRDPVLHLVRNALDHGIEAPEERVQRQKRPCGNIRLMAEIADGQLAVTVEDDGRGIDRASVARVAAQQDIHFACDPRHLSDAQMAGLIFTPGFTTASEKSVLSGRGVGLDIVNDAVQRLGGCVALEDCPGQGVTITLKVPLKHAA